MTTRYIAAAFVALLALLSSFIAWLIAEMNPAEPRLSVVFMVAAVVLAGFAQVLFERWPEC